jgi:hypothetical protein
MKSGHLMQYREIIAVCSEIHAEHTVWAESGIAECETGGTYSDHWALNGLDTMSSLLEVTETNY